MNDKKLTSYFFDYDMMVKVKIYSDDSMVIEPIDITESGEIIVNGDNHKSKTLSISGTTDYIYSNPGEVTSTQWEIIKVIKNRTGREFTGSNSAEAYEFIGKFFREAGIEKREY